MKRAMKIGMDVHAKGHVPCAVQSVYGGEPKILGGRKMPADFRNVLVFAAEIVGSYRDHTGIDETEIECGYEAGCLGYALIVS